MFSSVGDTSIKKLNTITRRMFIISAAKVVVFTGIVTRLFSLQINENLVSPGNIFTTYSMMGFSSISMRGLGTE